MSKQSSTEEQYQTNPNTKSLYEVCNFIPLLNLLQYPPSLSEAAYTYGKMGEIINEKRTIYTPNTANGSTVSTYEQKYSYDSWNRLDSMTYPDGEILVHRYDEGGNLKKVMNTQGYEYVKTIAYDPRCLKSSSKPKN
jgi:hypothetical protein